MSLSNMAAPAAVFSALGDPTRLALLTRLSEGGPKSITALAAGTPITRQAVTKHLQILEGAGLVHHAVSGRERIWEVEADRLRAAREYLDRISKGWDATLERLRAHVEGT